MKITYDVSKEKNSNRYYAHAVGFSYIPVFGSFGTKKEALHAAAACMGLPYREYMMLRRNSKGVK